MIKLAIFAGMFVVLLILLILQRIGLVKLPSDSNVLLVWLLLGIPCLCAGVTFIFSIYIKITEGEGMDLVMFFSPVIILGLIGFNIGWAFYKMCQRRGSDVQKLELND